jgi:hypothetical protein
VNQITGYIILTYRPRSSSRTPFSRVTAPMMWETELSAIEEMKQCRLNYPGQRFTVGTVIMDTNQAAQV